MSKEAINECIYNIVNGNFIKAKSILAERLKKSSNTKIIGSAIALEGIIAKYSGKNTDIKNSIEDFKIMKKGINEKLSAVWIDDFEKGFFSVWKIFVKTAIENLDNKESVIENPAEKE